MTYINDAVVYERISTQACSLKRWKIGQNDVNTSLYYFDWIEFLVGGFWAYAVELARLSDDEVIYFYDIEQAASGDFEKKFGTHPAIQLSTKMTEQEYISALNKPPNEHVGRAFALATTSAYLLFPASMKWHVHGEYSIELAELATTVGLPQSPEFPHDFWEASEAKRRIDLLK